MDKTGADFLYSVGTIHDRLQANAHPIQLPIGAEDLFEGVIDLVEMKAIYNEGSVGENLVVKEIPADYQDQAEEYREKLIEAVAEFDEDFMEKYLGGEEITIDELKAAIRKATLSVEFFPVVCGSAFKYKGVQPMLDAVVEYLPSPLDVPAIKGIDPNTDEETERHSSDAVSYTHLTLPTICSV